MQYSFTLPGDYDMEVIRRRIAAKGSLMDRWPQLTFKAYLHASREGRKVHSLENLYSPFYLWHSNEGMTSFLRSEGFEKLTGDFGWPSVKTWSVLGARLSASLRDASIATREVSAIPAFSKLSEIERTEVETLERDISERGAVGAVTGYDPTSWSLVRFRLWDELRADFDVPSIQAYEVGHMSAPTEPLSSDAHEVRRTDQSSALARSFPGAR